MSKLKTKKEILIKRHIKSKKNKKTKKTKKKDKDTNIIENPRICWKKIKKNSYKVIIDRNIECGATINIYKLKNINDIPMVTDNDLIIIDIPLKTLKRDTIVKTFYTEKDKKKQKKNLHIFHIVYSEIGDKICLPQNNIKNPKEYSDVQIFPDNVNRGVVGMLIGK